MLHRPNPRDNPSTVLAAVTFGLLVLLVPPRATDPAGLPELPAVVPALTGPAALPVQKVVTISAQPVVLSRAAALRGDPTVSLTFDDGPDPTWTPQVLDLLRRNAAVATFCVVGAQARKHPELVRDIVESGMRLCDHTRNHPGDLTVVPEPVQRTEILDARSDLLAATGDAPVAYFRAPGGHWSPEVLRLAAEQGMQPLGWSVDLRDWEQPGRLQILTTLEQNLRPGAVILMHDGGGNRAQTVEALGLMLPWLREAGYRFTFPTP